LLKCLAGAGMLAVVWPVVKEARWSFSWEALGMGTVVFVFWVALDSLYPKLYQGGGPAWNPFEQFGASSALAWTFVAIRIFGSTLIVPPIEELFYRSFLYRYIISPKFESISLKQFHWPAFLVVCGLFGIVHREWVAGILCGAAYQYLVLRHGRLNEAMLAHAVTNFLLGWWVVGRGAWQFW
jgi:uncharacterized protein